MRIIPRSTWAAVALVVVSGLVAIAFTTREQWLGWLTAKGSKVNAEADHPPATAEQKILQLSEQARKNLALVSKPVVVKTFWRKIQIPGVIVDRPGHSDRGITAPAVGVITKVHAFPGDTVKAGERLVTLRLISEYLQNTQSELFKAMREMQLVKEQRDRLEGPAKTGAIPEAKLIELDNQGRRLTAAVQAYRQDLLTRGLNPAQIDGVSGGKFVSEIEVVAPAPPADDKQLVSIQPVSFSTPAANGPPAYEVQELRAELGQQVQAGQLLCILANHHSLYIEGHSFKREASYLQRAARKGWAVRIEFAEDDPGAWPPSEQTVTVVCLAAAINAASFGFPPPVVWPPLKPTYTIRHLANALDPATRTFDFFLLLANESRHYEKEGHTFLVWRYRPGEHVYLHVPVEQFKDVIVLPAAAVVREGPEAYVFVQNGDLFERRSVHVLYEDRLNVVLANDRSVEPGMYLAQNAAASLNRVLKAQNASGGLPAGAHFHADGSLHIPGQ